MEKFVLTVTNNAGEATRDPVECSTVTGVLLQCHPDIDHSHVQQVCDMAAANPDYPYQIAAWKGTPESRYMCWSADLIFTKGNS